MMETNNDFIPLKFDTQFAKKIPNMSRISFTSCNKEYDNVITTSLNSFKLIHLSSLWNTYLVTVSCKPKNFTSVDNFQIQFKD